MHRSYRIAEAIILCKDVKLTHLHPVKKCCDSESEPSDDEHLDGYSIVIIHIHLL